MDKTSKHNINMGTLYFNCVLNQMDLTDIYGIFYPTSEYTFFSSLHGTFSRIDLMLVQKTSLNRFKNIEIMCIFSDHNSMKPETNYKRKTGKITKLWR